MPRKNQRQRPLYKPNKAKYLLAEAGLTQMDIAEDLGITQPAVSNMLNGYSYSQRFWDHFEEITGARPARKAS
jgi:predicted transcriptional regulator